MSQPVPRPDGLPVSEDLPRPRLFATPRARDLLPVALALAAVSALTFAAGPRLGEPERLMLYLAAVGIGAWRGGLVAGLAAALIAVGLQNFLFAEPHFTFLIADRADLITLSVFLAAAAALGGLTGQLRSERDRALQEAQLLALVGAHARGLHEGRDLQAILLQTGTSLHEITAEPVMIFGLETQNPRLLQSLPPGLTPSPADLWQAGQCLAGRSPVPASADGWNGSSFSFLPVSTAGGRVFALGHHRMARGQNARLSRSNAAATIARQAKLAIERLDFATDASGERLRAALLSSLSHDLRTPLASILGAASTLNTFGADLPPATATGLLTLIEGETRRLSSYVANLLQMTRLEAGVTITLDWVDPADCIEEAMARIRAIAPARPLKLEGEALPVIRSEAGLLSQALFNLMDNALRYTAGAVTLSTSFGEGEIRIAIRDEGAGLSALASPGLGLRITRAIAGALGGRLEISEAPGGGLNAVLILPLPLAGEEPDAQAEPLAGAGAGVGVRAGEKEGLG